MMWSAVRIVRSGIYVWTGLQLRREYRIRHYRRVEQAIFVTNKRRQRFRFFALVSSAIGTTALVLATVLQPFVDDNAVAGMVTLVGDRIKIIDITTVGFADVAAQRRMDAEDMFWSASMGKPIAATALMMLVDEGKVSVEWGNPDGKDALPVFTKAAYKLEK